MLRFPELAEPLLNWFTSVSAGGLLPARLREVAILTTGSRYRAA
jgi:4-carboxymuconolactone decarboxylase